MPKQHDDQYSEQEAQRRFEKLVDAALRTPPKPLKNVPRKWTEKGYKTTRQDPTSGIVLAIMAAADAEYVPLLSVRRKGATAQQKKRTLACWYDGTLHELPMLNGPLIVPENVELVAVDKPRIRRTTST
jgi:hypothetical protein